MEELLVGDVQIVQVGESLFLHLYDVFRDDPSLSCDEGGDLVLGGTCCVQYGVVQERPRSENAIPIKADPGVTLFVILQVRECDLVVVGSLLAAFSFTITVLCV